MCNIAFLCGDFLAESIDVMEESNGLLHVTLCRLECDLVEAHQQLVALLWILLFSVIIWLDESIRHDEGCSERLYCLGKVKVDDLCECRVVGIQHLLGLGDTFFKHVDDFCSLTLIDS